ncbi:MAG: asparagine synthase (glutamine-hydrolyzing) [Acidobacteria bacterium]|nr:asparagine synthase (glutamine-hydrolyzing) [Acidobacteriota bacterium]
MCGIAGLVTRDARPDLAEVVTGMATRLRHRGPDDSGIWVDSSGRFAMSHRRLAVVDLSPTGHQPMISHSGRHVLAFNGEIYNFRALRCELTRAGAAFRGTSDTEVLLAGIERWGMRETVQRSVGMFALAAWDTHARVLTLARDRMGEKPLFVARLPWGLAFASELRAFEALPGWRYDVDPRALASLLRFGYIVESGCIDRKVGRLLPGTLQRVRADDVAAGTAPAPAEAYWSLQLAIESTEVPRRPQDAVEHLAGLLRDSLEGQRIADVPLGSFLSGGIDSSVITAVLQRVSAGPVRTFSIGFDIEDYDESSFARAVADHLGCQHTEYRVSAADALGVVHDLPDVFDEPFADPSQVPTILVSRLARRAVTVCLSGDGGDELFGGYNRYFWSGRWGKRFASLPRPVRAAVGGAGGVALQTMPDSLLRLIVSRQVGSGSTQNPRGKLEKALSMLRLDDPVQRYSQLTRIIDPDELLQPAVGDLGTDGELARLVAVYGEVFGAMVSDIEGYLPGDQLVRVDRASMSVGLELRAPLLDHRVAAFAVAATRAFGEERLAAEPKWLLREVLYRHVPRALVDRPKMGFSIPLHRWLRVELREWAESLLTPDALERSQLLSVARVRRLWTEHLGGMADHGRALWSVLMFQQWSDAARRRQVSVD